MLHFSFPASSDAPEDQKDEFAVVAATGAAAKAELGHRVRAVRDNLLGSNSDVLINKLWIALNFPIPASLHLHGTGQMEQHQNRRF